MKPMSKDAKNPERRRYRVMPDGSILDRLLERVFRPGQKKVRTPTKVYQRHELTPQQRRRNYVARKAALILVETAKARGRPFRNPGAYVCDERLAAIVREGLLNRTSLGGLNSIARDVAASYARQVWRDTDAS